MSTNVTPEQHQNGASNRRNGTKPTASKKFAVRGQSGYSLLRKSRPVARHGDGRGVYHPIWYVELRKPGAERLDTTSAKWIPGGAELCAECLAVDRPALNRAGCRCQVPLRRAIEAELSAAVTALAVTLREGRVEQYTRLHEPKAKAATATVQDVIDAVEGIKDADGAWVQRRGPEIWKANTWRVYRASLVRLARQVNEEKPEKALLADVLTRRTIEALQCEVQGVQGVNDLNRRQRLDCNGAVNTTVRNVKALFSAEACLYAFAGLSLPDLAVLREMPALPSPVTGFVPWAADVWARFVAESEALRTVRPDLWLVNAFLRRTGMRDEELLKAKRSWITLDDGKPVLEIKDRGAEFSILKGGKGRRIGLDDELWQLVKDLPMDMPLVGGDVAEWRRAELIGREHSAFVRQFIPDRVKSNHELRMMAGSIVCQLHGLLAAADFLGHKSLETTRKYYAAQLKASAPLTGSMVG